MTEVEIVDERAALEAIVRFVDECLSDPEIVEALILEECAQAGARGRGRGNRVRAAPGVTSAEAQSPLGSVGHGRLPMGNSLGKRDGNRLFSPSKPRFAGAEPAFPQFRLIRAWPTLDRAAGEISALPAPSLPRGASPMFTPLFDTPR